MDKNSFVFSHSSHSVLLKDSMKAFSTRFPGPMKSRRTPHWYARSEMYRWQVALGLDGDPREASVCFCVSHSAGKSGSYQLFLLHF